MTIDTTAVENLTPGAQQLLAVASDLFYEHGIHAVGVDTIASEAGITKPVLYKNFGSKDGLVVAYLTQRHRAWWPTVEEALSQAETPRALTFFDIYMRDAQTITRGCAYLNAAAELSEDHPAYPVIRYHKHAVCQRIRELIEEDSPATESPKRVADHLFLLLEGAFAHHRVYGRPLLAEAREMAEQVLGGAHSA